MGGGAGGGRGGDLDFLLLEVRRPTQQNSVGEHGGGGRGHKLRATGDVKEVPLPEEERGGGSWWEGGEKVASGGGSLGE